MVRFVFLELCIYARLPPNHKLTWIWAKHHSLNTVGSEYINIFLELTLASDEEEEGPPEKNRSSLLCPRFEPGASRETRDGRPELSPVEDPYRLLLCPPIDRETRRGKPC